MIRGKTENQRGAYKQNLLTPLSPPLPFTARPPHATRAPPRRWTRGPGTGRKAYLLPLASGAYINLIARDCLPAMTTTHRGYKMMVDTVGVALFPTSHKVHTTHSPPPRGRWSYYYSLLRCGGANDLGGGGGRW